MTIARATHGLRQMLSGIPCVLAVSALLVACSAQEEPCCASQPIKPFKAVYEYSVDDGPAVKQTWVSNGKGQVLITSESDKDVTTILDFEKRQSTTINNKEKSASSTHLKTPWISNGTCDETDATVLGDKTIDGHPCKGWKVKDGNKESEYWLGDDVGCYVVVDSTLPESKRSTLKLVEYQSELPQSISFDIPADYTVR